MRISCASNSGLLSVALLFCLLWLGGAFKLRPMPQILTMLSLAMVTLLTGFLVSAAVEKDMRWAMPLLIVWLALELGGLLAAAWFLMAAGSSFPLPFHW